MAAAKFDQKLVLAALKKRQAGQRLTQREERAVHNYELAQREQHGLAYMAAMPKKDYLAGAGVANKVMLEQSQRLGLPWRPHDKTVDVMAVLAAFHSLIAQNPSGFYRAAATAMSANDPSRKEFFPDDEPDWQTECWKERAIELADKRKLRHREMLHSEAVALSLNRIAELLQTFGDNLGKRFGSEAQKLFSEAWEDVERDVMALIAGDDDRLDSDGSDSKKDA